METHFMVVFISGLPATGPQKLFWRFSGERKSPEAMPPGSLNSLVGATELAELNRLVPWQPSLLLTNL